MKKIICTCALVGLVIGCTPAENTEPVAPSSPETNEEESVETQPPTENGENEEASDQEFEVKPKETTEETKHEETTIEEWGSKVDINSASGMSTTAIPRVPPHVLEDLLTEPCYDMYKK